MYIKCWFGSLADFILLVLIFLPFGVGKIQLILPYQGITVRSLINSSVNFTWRFSGDVAGIEFGFKATNAATIEKNGRILFLNTFGKTVYVHQSFTGRVTGSRTGNSSSGQVIFNLSGITLNDTDTYGCQLYANNVQDSGQFDYARLIVEEIPRIKHPVTANISYSQGSPVNVSCIATGTPESDVVWISISTTQVMSSGFEKAYLIFSSISKADAGIYICRANNSAGSVEKTFELTVKYPAVIQGLTSSSPMSCIGHTVTLTCKSDAVPIPTLTWYKPDGTNFSSVKATESTVNLTMNSSVDFGLYNCTAENGFTLASKTVRVGQIGIPEGALINDLPVETKNVKVNLKWKKSQNSGAPITKYTVYQRIVNDGDTSHEWAKVQDITSVSVREVAVDLEIGRDYEFVVTASNKCGESKKEVEKIKRISVLGDVPDAVEVTDGIILKWKEPDNNGAVIIEYSVYQRFANDDEWKKIATIIDVYNRSYAVEIEKGKEYEFVVTATNKYGESSMEQDIKRIKVLDVSTKPPKTQAGSESSNTGVLHGAYISVILLLSIILFILIVVLWKMRLRSGSLHSNNEQEGGETIALKPIEDVEPIEQPSSATEQAANFTYEILGEEDYMPLHPSRRSWEISREHVEVIKVIGKGAFSDVAKATLRNMRDHQEIIIVAAKMLKANAPDSDRKDLLSELELMKKLKPHPHVIKLMACVTESDPLLVLIEYVPYGDLLGYLRKSRGLNDTYFKDPDIKLQTSLSADQLMKFAWQVADGMCYLSSKKVIHRDLAARNVLVGEGEKCKVTDFGMARDVQQDEIYTKTSRGRLPVKWTAYEALLYGVYTTQSDVWSYGILLYEILTVGGSPYPGIKPRQIAERLQKGYRMPKPKHVDDKLYQVMLKCWKEEPNDRPTFQNLHKTIKEMERKHKTYVNLRQYDGLLYANVHAGDGTE